jgi:hypothetical protein
VTSINEILVASEKEGGVTVDVRRCIRFGRWVQNCGLIDLGSNGPKFTWRGAERRDYVRVCERLDRCFGNSQWRLKFQGASVMVLPRVRSDHYPVLVVLQEQDRTLQGMNRPFCFEAAWFGHDNFTSFIQENWKHGADLPHALEVMTAQLKRWNKDVFGNIFMRKERVLAGLGGVQQALAVKGNSYLNRLENQLLTKYHQILRQEEVHWYQKSRCQWITFGDRNTSYFHIKTIIRRQIKKKLEH